MLNLRCCHPQHSTSIFSCLVPIRPDGLVPATASGDGPVTRLLATKDPAGFKFVAVIQYSSLINHCLPPGRACHKLSMPCSLLWKPRFGPMAVSILSLCVEHMHPPFKVHSPMSLSGYCGKRSAVKDTDDVFLLQSPVRTYNTSPVW